MTLTYLEIAGAIFGFLSVYFYITRNVWSWPTGLIQVALYTAVFYQARLYADMGLHVVYVMLQVYGWYAWLQSSAAPMPSSDHLFEHSPEAARESNALEPPAFPSTSLSTIQVRSLTRGQQLSWLCGMCGLTIGLGWSLQQWTDAQFPWIDSYIAASSLIAQILLAQRYWENWVLWISVDIAGMGLFSVKELYPTALLYGLFLIMAVVGLHTWLRAASPNPRSAVS